MEAGAGIDYPAQLRKQAVNVEKLNRLIADVQADRKWFHDRFEQTRRAGTPNYGLSIDASACAIRERALLDAKECFSGVITLEDKK